MILHFFCHAPLKVETHGAGVRYACPHCDTLSSSPGSRLPVTQWTHAPLPKDRRCDKRIKLWDHGKSLNGDYFLVELADGHGLARQLETVGLGEFVKFNLSQQPHWVALPTEHYEKMLTAVASRRCP